VAWRRVVLKAFVMGFLVAVILVVGALSAYLALGMAPAAVADSPLPFERRLAHMALNSHIDRQQQQESPVAADESNLRAGARVYKDGCAICHGLPGRPAALGDNLYPHAPQLFRGKGVTDDPVYESYWKVTNGIRLTGMPAFVKILSEQERWQVSQLLANADKLSGDVTGALAPGEAGSREAGTGVAAASR
jgi:thiosulfate dehydrogenase